MLGYLLSSHRLALVLVFVGGLAGVAACGNTSSDAEEIIRDVHGTADGADPDDATPGPPTCPGTRTNPVTGLPETIEVGLGEVCVAFPDDCWHEVCTEDGCVGEPYAENSPCGDHPAPCGQFLCRGGRCTEVVMADDEPCGDHENPCKEFRCQGGECQERERPNTVPCGNVHLCYEGDYCQAGQCRPGPIPKCEDGNPCTIDQCDDETGACSFELRRDLTPCDDDDICTLETVCRGGECQGRPRCDDGDPCTANICDATTGDCQFRPLDDGAECDDGDPCTVATVCAEGLCIGEPKPCESENPCTLGSCVAETGECEFAPVEDGTVCDDLERCTTETSCLEGECVGIPIDGCCHDDDDCDDGDPCTESFCLTDRGFCSYAPLAPCALPTGGCEGYRCGPTETCEVVSLVRPTLLWRLDFDAPNEPHRALRAWPPAAWSLEEGAGRHGGRGLVAVEPRRAYVHLPPQRIPAGTVVLEVWLRTELASCPEGEMLAELWATDETGQPMGDEPLDALPCPHHEGFLQWVVPVGSDFREVRSLRLDRLEDRALVIAELRIVHLGRQGCHIGKPRVVPGTDGVSYVAVSPGTSDSAALAWVRARGQTHEVSAASLCEEQGVSDFHLLADSVRVSGDFAISTAEYRGSRAVAWGANNLGKSTAVQYSPDGSQAVELPLSDPLFASADRPAVVRLEAAGFLYSWFADAATGQGIMTLVAEPTGATAWGDVLSGAATTDLGSAPGLAVLQDGRPIAVWLYDGRLFARFATRRGVRIGAGPFLLYDPTEEAAELGRMVAPRVAALHNGGFVVVFELRGADGARDVGYLTADEDGVVVLPATRVNEERANTQKEPRVVGLADGGFAVAYLSDELFGNTFELRYRVYGPQGEEYPVLDPIAINPPMTVESLQLVVAGDRRVALVWGQGTSGLQTLNYLHMPSSCPLGYWACDGVTPVVCGPGESYFPLLGACTGGSCVAPVQCFDPNPLPSAGFDR
jgi:hypothetical protein